jgi:hypothetical protein
VRSGWLVLAVECVSCRIDIIVAACKAWMGQLQSDPEYIHRSQYMPQFLEVRVGGMFEAECVIDKVCEVVRQVRQ